MPMTKLEPVVQMATDNVLLDISWYTDITGNYFNCFQERKLRNHYKIQHQSNKVQVTSNFINHRARRFESKTKKIRKSDGNESRETKNG